MLRKKLYPLSAAICFLFMLPGCWQSDSKEEKKEPQKAASSEEMVTAVRAIQSQADFDAILKEGKPVIADFYADWCGACKHMKPIFNVVAKKYSNQANFVTMDSDTPDLQKLVAQYEVEALPTIIFADASGKKVKKQVGSTNQQSFDATVADFLKTAGRP